MPNQFALACGVSFTAFFARVKDSQAPSQPCQQATPRNKLTRSSQPVRERPTMDLHQPKPTLLVECARASNGATMDAEALLLCLANRMQTLEGVSNKQTADTAQWLLIFAGALVFMMQTGFAMLCAGCVRKKNLQNTMLKNILDVCGSAVGFYTIGYALAFGGQDERTGFTFVGSTDFFLTKDTIDPAFWFFQFCFAATAATIVAGTIAERCRMAAYICYSIFLTSFVYPTVAHAIWSNNGVLSAFAETPFRGIGCIDFSGSGVIHMVGGITALIAATIMGPRSGRFYDLEGNPLKKPKEIPGHSVSLQLLATLILWFGWYGFNPGSALLLPNAESTATVAARAAANTTLSGAFGGLSGLFINMVVHHVNDNEIVFSLESTMNGALAGLVGITGACGTVELWAAALIGTISGVIYIFGVMLLNKWKVDDVVLGIPIHFFCGVWSLIATGFLSSPSAMQEAFGTDEYAGWFYELGRGRSNATLLTNQLIAVLGIIAWTSALMIPFFLLLDKMNWLKASVQSEIVGLDEKYMSQSRHEAKVEIEEDVNNYREQVRKINKRRMKENLQANTADTLGACSTIESVDDSAV